MNENIDLRGSVIHTISDFHSTMCKTVPMQVAMLAHTLLFGSTPSDANIDEVRARLGDSCDVWIFPLLKQSVHTKTLVRTDLHKQDDAGRFAVFNGTIAFILRDHGGVLGLAEHAAALMEAMEEFVEKAIRAGRTVNEQDLLYAGVNEEKATDTTKPAEDNGVDLKFEHGNIKARLLEVRVDKDGNMVNLPDDLPAEIKAALESRVAELRAAGAL
jgi:hypothetical protein